MLVKVNKSLSKLSYGAAFGSAALYHKKFVKVFGTLGVKWAFFGRAL